MRIKNCVIRYFNLNNNFQQGIELNLNGFLKLSQIVAYQMPNASTNSRTVCPKAYLALQLVFRPTIQAVQSNQHAWRFARRVVVSDFHRKYLNRSNRAY